jgi:hypothetical protein
MRTILLIALTAIIASAGGCAVGFGGMLYLQDVAASNVTATGVLMYEQHLDSSASGLPPKGYYIDSTGVGRVYIETGGADDYLGKEIRAFGRLATLCGPDGVNCYPVVQSTEIVQTP